MADFVRVYIPESNQDATVPRRFAESVGLQILDKPAVNVNGNPLPPKPHVPLGERAVPKNSPAPKGEGKADQATPTIEANKEA